MVAVTSNMNVSTSSPDGRKSNHSNALSRSRSPSAGRRSPSSKRRASGPTSGHFGFPSRSGIDASSPYGPFNPAAMAAMRSTMPGYTGLLGTSSPPIMPTVTSGSPLPLPLGDGVPTGSDNIPLPLYQSPLWQAAVRQQQLQLLGQIASLGASTNPFLSTPSALHSPAPSHPTAQMPPTPGQVQAAAAAMLAATAASGGGTGGASFPSTTGIPHTPPSFAPPDSSSDDVPASGNAAALAALIAASVSTSSASPSSTSPAESSVALRAYRDYLNITNQLQIERSREPFVQKDKKVKQIFSSISSTLDKPGSDSTIIDSPTTSIQTSMPHSPAVLLMAEQFLRGKQSLSTTSTSSVTLASPITSHPSMESTQAKIPMTPFNVRPNLSNQESSLKSKHDILPPAYSSAHVSSSPTSLPYRHQVINAEDAKHLNLQLQQQAEAATLVNKLIAEGSSKVLSQADALPQTFIGVRSPEDLLPRNHPHHPHHRVGKPSLRSHQPQSHLDSNIAVSNSAPPSMALGIGDLLPAVTGGRGGRRGDGRSNRSSERGGAGGPVAYNGRDKVFTCKICNRSFGYKHVLQNHERTHTGEKPFECKVCNKRFTRDHHLKTHMRLHTGEKPYNCTHCDRQFVQVANLRRHLRVHTGEKPYKCDLCDARFSDSNQLKAHILIHKGEKPFNCDKCEGKFRRRHHLMHHVCPMVPKGSVPLSRSPADDHEERHQMSPPPLLPLPPHLARLSQTSDISAPKRGRKKQDYMEGPLMGVGSGSDELYKSSSPYAMPKGPIGHFDEENLKAMLKAATVIGVAAASGVPQSPSSDNLPQASLELGLRMLRAAEADRRTKLTEYNKQIEEELDSPTGSQTTPDTAITIGSNGSATGRSRKSRDPKRVRQSPTNYDDNIEQHQDVGVKPFSPSVTTTKLLVPSDLIEGKNIPLKTGNEEEDDGNDDNDTPRSSTELEEEIQTEPEDLSAKKISMSSAGLLASIRVKSKQELNLLLDPTSSSNKDDRMSPAGAKTHDPSSSIEPSEDDGKGKVVSTTGDEKEIFFGTNRNDLEPMEVDDEDDDDDNKENNSDTGTTATNSTSDLTTGINSSIVTGASPSSDIVAVTATASATSAVGVRANNVGGNGANNLHQVSIANN